MPKSESQVKRKESLSPVPVHFDGPIPSKSVNKLTRKMLHSPFEEKIREMKNVTVQELTVREDLTIVGISGNIDATGLLLLKDIDIPGQEKMPICIKPDGNCLPRVGSLFTYGTEDFHGDIRLRIARELVLHRDVYLDEKHLQRGVSADFDPQPTAKLYAQYSEHYLPGQPLAMPNITAIYNKECNDILKKGAFMGIWQIFALASILKCPLYSVYPNKGNPSVRRDLHRVIMPREMSNAKPLFFMWSTCRTDMNDAHWVPNHFLALLPVLECHECVCATETGCIDITV